MRVRYFAAARDAAGLDEELVDVAASATIADVRRVLIARHPSLERVLRQSRLALDQRFAREDDVVGAAVEIAVIPPVAGG